jgi:hypothetical protein
MSVQVKKMATHNIYPCPQCGEYRLAFDGILQWRSGSRPSRELARKNLPFPPRADYEREICYHCEHCGAEFFEDWDTSLIHLFAENGQVKYLYNAKKGAWQRENWDLNLMEWDIYVFDPLERKWKFEDRMEYQAHSDWMREITASQRGYPQIWRFFAQDVLPHQSKSAR